jgi:exopolysaccharide/PEP-CTERM locus tyrosine autokinase
MNRIEEAIQKAKTQAAARQETAPVGEAVAPLPPRDLDASGRMRALDLSRMPSPETLAAQPLVLDRRKLAENGLWPSEEAGRRLADEFRVVKRSLAGSLHASQARGSTRRVIAVASALAGEGKTFSAFNLALSLSMERDTNVLLIDGDVARPTLTRVLGVERAPGLLDLLEHHDLPVEQALYRSDIERLWFMGSGNSRMSRAELLGSPRMGALLEQLTIRVPGLMIVFDTPPLMPTVESRVLADAADVTLLVVKANETPQAAVMQALEFLGKDRPVQLMLNQRRETRLDKYYYYGYGTYGARAE